MNDKKFKVKSNKYNAVGWANWFLKAEKKIALFMFDLF